MPIPLENARFCQNCQTVYHDMRSNDCPKCGDSHSVRLMAWLNPKPNKE